MFRTVGVFVGALVLGVAIGSGVTLLVRDGDEATKRTAPEIVKALQVTDCQDIGDNVPAHVSSPIRSSSGDWFVECVWLFAKEGKPDPFSACYRIKPDTLEVTQFEGGPAGPPCANLTDWPKP